METADFEPITVAGDRLTKWHPPNFIATLCSRTQLQRKRQ